MKCFISIILLFLLGVSSQLSAQIHQTVTVSDLVVEGEVLSTNAEWNEDQTLIITKNTIAVTSVFKGHPVSSTIIVVTNGGIVDEGFHFTPHAIVLHKGEKGYFFLQKDDQNKYVFPTYSQGLYLLTGGHHPIVFTHEEIFHKTAFEDAIVSVTRFPKLSARESFALYNSSLFSENDTCDIITSLRNQKTIAFSFDNVTYSDNFTHIEFDVMAQTNTSGLKFGRGNLFLSYSDAFGSNAVSTQTVEITKSAILEDPLYTLAYQDATAQTIAVTADAQYGANTMHTFSQTPEPLLHVKLRITDFTQIGSISFDDITVTGSVQYWCQGAFGAFDKVILDGPITSTTPPEGAGTGITYTFENLSVNSSNTELSVDLFAVATAATRYSDGFFFIDYNALGFGENVVSNGAVTFIQDDVLEDPSIYSTFLVDDDNNTLHLIVSSDFEVPATDLSLLGSTARKLGRFTFSNVLDCEEEKGIGFNPKTITDQHLHNTGTMPFPLEQYDPVIASDTETGKICGCDKPIITSFSPSTIRAGTGEILTITGQNFGTFDLQNSTVMFKNGDDGSNVEYMEAGSKDFEWNGVVHWSDTKIEIKVPSTDKNAGAMRPAATGDIKVKNTCDMSDPSSQKLQIPYAVLNVRNGFFDSPVKLTIKETDLDGICFQFSNQVPGWIRTQFELALNEWCSETGINFFIGETVPENNRALDGINLIVFQSGSSGVGGEMVLTPTYFAQTCTENEIGRIFSEIDFRILSGITNPTLDDERRMKEIIIHELGHSHMLAHSNSGVPASQYIMHPSGNIGGFITSSDSEGANRVFPNSANIVQGSCGIPIKSGLCSASCGTNAVHGLGGIAFDFVVYPNPTDGVIEVEVNTSNADGIVTITDIHGKVIQKETVSFPLKNYVYSLPSASGVYIITIDTGTNTASKRVIKL